MRYWGTRSLREFQGKYRRVSNPFSLPCVHNKCLTLICNLWIRYRVLDDRKRSLLSVLLMKLALTNYYDISPKEVKIVREKGMKPYFKYSRENARQIHFNVSHDGDIVVIILSKRVVGIDVMKSELPLRSRSSGSSVEEAKEKFLNNMKNIFQPSEWNYIQRDISRFMRYWTIKESFVKYVGLGLYIDPKRLLIDLNDTVEDNCNTLNSLSLEKASIYMDNQIQVRISREGGENLWKINFLKLTHTVEVRDLFIEPDYP